MADDSTSLSVPSSGVTLAVERHGVRSGETVILVHGYPDNRHVWDRVVPLLAHDFDVVTYDTRGAGGTTSPSDRAGYRIERLVDDVAAVIEAVRPDGGAVHLVGHDWGSVQLWAAVFAAGADERLRGRISSFVSISGPDLRLYGAYLRGLVRARRWRRLFDQLAKSWYVAAFQVPLVPELVIGRATDRVRGVLARSQGLDRGHWGPSFVRDATNGVNLYRANAFRAASAPLPEPTDVPVTLVVPVKDDFLSPSLYDDLPSYVPRLVRHDVDAGHWVPWLQPELIASTVRSTVTAAVTREQPDVHEEDGQESSD